MKKIGQRDRAVQLVWKRLAWVALLVLVVILGRAAWDMYMRWKEATKYQERATAELSGILERETELRKDIASLKDGHGVETALRDRFGLAKEGEGVIVIVDEEVVENAAESSSWWARWFNW